MKIGLFGGSFNPIHNAHLEIINKILDKKIVDKIWIIPCNKHAFGKNLEKNWHRVNMINLAIKNNPKIKLDRTELNSNSKSYTIKTLKKLKKKYNHEFFLIVGSDILIEIKKWYDSKSLLKETKFIIIKRRDYSLKEIKGLKIYKTLIKKLSNISSSIIRKNILENKSIKKMVLKKVENYIIKNNLYKIHKNKI
jgi:nicotinate-nucleotide adenylyltransferase